MISKNRFQPVSRFIYKFVLISLFVFYLPADLKSQTHEDWSYNLNIYEVNTRQYTKSGTFKAFEPHLDRLKDMGVGIIWFMPINPIGIKNRLGSLGSPYSIKDYTKVNPEFGTMEDFKALVDSIHSKGMYVIIDWVPNHTSWDNELTTLHPEWYVKNSSGNFTPPPGTNWSDVIQLDYSKQALRDSMINAMKFWIEEVGIDGFRCDAVSFMPSDFWSKANAELRKVKPDVFMLAEDDNTKYQYIGFNSSYAWGMYGFGYGVLKNIVNGTNTVINLDAYINNELKNYTGNHYRMYFTSNHDENSWHGTTSELFGSAAESFAVLTATISDMQLIYGGQEAGLNKRLAFFDKDEIIWNAHAYEKIYSLLWNLKKENKALWNGNFGGAYKKVNTTNNQKIFSFVREKEEDKIFAIFNLSSNSVTGTISDSIHFGTYVEIFTDDTVNFTQSSNIDLNAWGYNLYKKIDNPTDVKQNLVKIEDFKLLQNYPNPFNPTTVINFELPEASQVELKIYNMLGQEIATLVNEEKPVGRHSVQFNASTLSSGIYIYQIKANNFIQSKKMILMK